MISKSLLCPICRLPLSESGGSLVCAARHTYDISSDGHINFNTKLSSSGDSKDMIRARSDFLDAGYYSAFAAEVADAVSSEGKVVIDAGCGDGYYSNAILNYAAPEMLYGFDLSKSAVSKAAKRNRNFDNSLFCVCGIFDLPLASLCADSIVSLFAPIADKEFLRLLKPGGSLIVGIAGKNHLLGLKQAVYEKVYLNDPEKISAPDGFAEVSRKSISYEVTIEDSKLIRDLFKMTPYFWKTSKSDSEKLEKLQKLTTPLEFELAVFIKK